MMTFNPCFDPICDVRRGARASRQLRAAPVAFAPALIRAAHARRGSAARGDTRGVTVDYALRPDPSQTRPSGGRAARPGC